MQFPRGFSTLVLSLGFVSSFYAVTYSVKCKQLYMYMCVVSYVHVHVPTCIAIVLHVSVGASPLFLSFKLLIILLVLMFLKLSDPLYYYYTTSFIIILISIIRLVCAILSYFVTKI